MNTRQYIGLLNVMVSFCLTASMQPAVFALSGSHSSQPSDDVRSYSKELGLVFLSDPDQPSTTPLDLLPLTETTKRTPGDEVNADEELALLNADVKYRLLGRGMRAALEARLWAAMGQGQARQREDVRSSQTAASRRRPFDAHPSAHVDLGSPSPDARNVLRTGQGKRSGEGLFKNVALVGLGKRAMDWDHFSRFGLGKRAFDEDNLEGAGLSNRILDFCAFAHVGLGKRVSSHINSRSEEGEERVLDFKSFGLAKRHTTGDDMKNYNSSNKRCLEFQHYFAKFGLGKRSFDYKHYTGIGLGKKRRMTVDVLGESGDDLLDVLGESGGDLKDGKDGGQKNQALLDQTLPRGSKSDKADSKRRFDPAKFNVGLGKRIKLESKEDVNRLTGMKSVPVSVKDSRRIDPRGRHPRSADEDNETDADGNADSRIQKQFDGKSAASFLATLSQLVRSLDQLSQASGGLQGKRQGHLVMDRFNFDVGLGKRVGLSDKQFGPLSRYGHFGLGKRGLPSHQFSHFGLGKRGFPSHQFSHFGLGKRGLPSHQFSQFGLGKRGLPSYQFSNFGLGKRGFPSHQFSHFGLGKKEFPSHQFSHFGLGKRGLPSHQFSHFGLGIKEFPSDQFSHFGLGKRGFPSQQFGHFGLGKRGLPSHQFSHFGLGKRGLPSHQFSHFGLGKRGLPSHQFSHFGLGKRGGLPDYQFSQFGLGGRSPLSRYSHFGLGKRDPETIENQVRATEGEAVKGEEDPSDILDHGLPWTGPFSLTPVDRLPPNSSSDPHASSDLLDVQTENLHDPSLTDTALADYDTDDMAPMTSAAMESEEASEQWRAAFEQAVTQPATKRLARGAARPRPRYRRRPQPSTRSAPLYLDRRFMWFGLGKRGSR